MGGETSRQMDKPGLQGEHPASNDREMERSAQERPAELARTNRILRKEIATRLKVEQELQRRSRELQLLHQVTLKVSSSLDLEVVISMVLDGVRHLLSATGCTVWRLEPEQGRLVCWQASGPDSELLNGIQIPVGEGLLGWTAQHGRELLVVDTRTDPRHFKGVDARTGTEIRCILCLPLKIKDRLAGILEVVSDRPGFFSESDLVLLKPLAASAAVAIENARLYFEAQRLRTFNETIVQHMREGIVLEDAAGQITFANPAAAEMLDCSIQDLVGRDWRSLIAPEHLEWVAVKGSGGRYETVLRTASKRRLPVLVSTETLSDDRHLAGKLTTFSDVSDRRAADQELRNRNQELCLLNSLISASVQGETVEEILGAVCRELAFAFHASNVAAALFDDGLSRGTIVARYPSSSQFTTAGAVLLAPNQRWKEEMIQTKAPLLLAADSGDTAWSESLAPPGAASILLLPVVIENQLTGCLALTQGAPHTFSAAQANLARHAAEQVSGSLARARLNEQQKRLLAAAEQATEAVLITDATGSVLYVNFAFAQITGYTRDDLVGQDLASIDPDLWDRLANGEPYQGRCLRRKKDGTQFLADETAGPVRSSAGEITSYAVTMRDVSHVVALEEQYYHAQKMEAVGRIAGAIAHDYKNVLTIIEMASAILAMQMHLKDPQREHVASIQEASRRARDLTQELLRFSRRDSARPEILDLNRLIGDMGWLLQCLLDEDIQLHPALSPEPVRVRADPSQIEQVIMNLVINARDAMPAGGTLAISTSRVALEESLENSGSRRAADFALLTVADTGVGMDATVRAHLFEPFFTTKEQGKGTGLGLSTVLSIVKQNGGHIEVDSAPGRGSNFRVYLPLARQEGEPQAASDEGDLGRRESEPSIACPLGLGLEGG